MSLAYQTDASPEDPADETPSGPYLREPAPVYTYLLIGGITAVAMMQFVTGLELSIMRAGFDKPAFVNAGEYWRMLTGAATHGGIAHLAMNSLAFYSFGRIFEMLTDRAHLAIVFLLSAIGGSVLSLIFVPDGLSVGASGGVVGLIGYITVYAFRRRQFVTAEFRKSLLINIGTILIFGLFLYQVVDNFGHIGGLITGAVYALVQVPSSEYADPRAASGPIKIAGLVSLGVYLAGCVFAILVMTGSV